MVVVVVVVEDEEMAPSNLLHHHPSGTWDTLAWVGSSHLKNTRTIKWEGWRAGTHLQVVAHLLAVGDSLDLRRGAEVEGLPPVSEAKGPRDAHVRQWQVIYIHQWPETGQTAWVTGWRDKLAPRGEGSTVGGNDHWSLTRFESSAVSFFVRGCNETNK